MFMQEPIVKACVESVPETLPYPTLTLTLTLTPTPTPTLTLTLTLTIDPFLDCIPHHSCEGTKFDIHNCDTDCNELSFV